MYNRVEQKSSLYHKVATRREIVVPGKHIMTNIMLVLKEAEIKVEPILVYIHQGLTAKKEQE